MDTQLEPHRPRSTRATARAPGDTVTMLDLDPRNRPVLRAATITVAVLADDRLTGRGAVAVLRTQPGLRVLPTEQQHQAEVVVILVDRVTDRTLAWMQSELAAADGSIPRFILVGDGVREHHGLRAASHGLITVLSRREADFERIAQAVRDGYEGRPESPAVELGRLITLIRSVRLDVLTPDAPSPRDFETRELDVLRLLAEGWETGDIAVRLSFSERTVKNIIHGLLTRLGLHNRTHAVSFALRNDLL